MSVSNEVVRALYSGNGSTTTFAIAHEIISDAGDEVEVYLIVTATKVETLQTEGADYSISGSNVVFNVAPATGYTVLVQRKIALTQPVDLNANSGYPAETTEEALDRLTAEIQLLNLKIRRSLVTRISIPTADLDLTLPDPEAAKYLRWKADGSGLENAEEVDVDGQLTLPGSSTDNALALWNGATGNAIKDSSIIVGSSGELTGVPSIILDYKTKTANYPLTAAETVVTGDATGGAFAFTLPSAVGITGKTYTLMKTDASTNAISLATTSAQTVGGRASSDVKLRQLGDYAEVVSDGANWQIKNKKETQFTSDNGNISFATIGASGRYGTAVCIFSIFYGVWEIEGSFQLHTGDAEDPAIDGNSGFYAADGANSSVQPTQLGAEVIEGTPLFVTDTGLDPITIKNATLTTTAGSRYVSRANKIVIATTSTIPIYLVPRISYVSAGTATVHCVMKARRLW